MSLAWLLNSFKSISSFLYLVIPHVDPIFQLVTPACVLSSPPPPGLAASYLLPSAHAGPSTGNANIFLYIWPIG